MPASMYFMQKYAFQAELWLLRVFLFCLPFQLRFIFASWSPHVQIGVGAPVDFGFNEWTAGFIYGTDVIFLALLVLWMLRTRAHQKTKSRSFESIILVLFAGTAAWSFVAAQDIGIAVFRYLKLAEGIMLFWYIRNAIHYFGRIELLRPLIAVLLVQAGLSIVQIGLQHNAGAWFLGEGAFVPGGHSVAAFRVGAELFLRAYGTFQHPNVLAFFAFIVLNLTQAYYIFSPEKISKRMQVLFGVSTVSALWVIGLTFSRSVMLLVIGMRVVLFLLAWFLHHQERGRRVVDVLVISLSTIAVFSFLYWPQVSARKNFDVQEEAYQERISYNSAAGKTAGSHKFTGVGMGHFVYDQMKKRPYLDRYYYQPAHNIFLLIAAEMGYLALAFFALFLGYVWLYRSAIIWRTDKTFALWRFMFLGAIISLGCIDHYQWTLHQGLLLFFIVLAII